jgi:methylthioribose-1-phosphate isomerase
MKPFEWIDGRIRFLDQTKLPLEEIYRTTDDAALIAEAIRCLAIRGAPLIGIAAAYGVALASFHLKSREADEVRSSLYSTIDFFGSTRPTAVNLFWALKRQRHIVDTWLSESIDDVRKRLLNEALLIHREDSEMCECISSFGVDILPPSCSVLTHCNAGVLATGGRGTVLGIITKAWEAGKLKCVYIDETRPLFQGARLTAWEMKQANIPSKLITDSTAAILMKQGKIDAVLVGADRIAQNGDVANKVGTYSIAVLAKHHRIPFYVVAPSSTFDHQIKTGEDIPIEERNERETTVCNGKRIAPEGTSVFSPAFDVTPNDFVSAIVTNEGVIYPPFSETLKQLKSNT